MKGRVFLRTAALFFFVLILFQTGDLRANTISELQEKIKDSNSEIQKIEQEIAAHQKDLAKTQAESLTLQNELNRIEITRKKHAADISLTQNKIKNNLLNIDRLQIEIGSSGQDIDRNKEAIGELMREIREAETDNLIEILLSRETLSGFLQATEELERLQKEVLEDMRALKELKVNLEEQVAEEKARNTELGVLKQNLEDQKAIADENAREQNRLIAVTKNKESEFQRMIVEKETRKRQFEQAIREAESQIQIIIDPSKLPDSGSGVLAWPVSKVIITQYFGNTPFASKNPRIYNGNGHNGIDLGMPTGTELKASASGTVLGIGDTDNTCRGASYGKWVLIRHNNGLSTLYAHLSLVRVQPNQQVAQGEIIGFSGNTGYSTGPHLHFTVFATEGVSIGQLKSQVPGCGTYTLPLASKSSYLNPLSYLPSN